MTPGQRFDLAQIAPQPWKNGAGVTREIAFGGASATAFDWRLSVAEVDRDAPFSAFPGVDRCIVLLQGAGMRLRSMDGSIDHALTARLEPFRFAGDVALDATLVGGACRDFNVMTRRGAFTSEVRVLREAGEIEPADVTALLCVAGAWQIDEVTLTPMQAVLLPLPLTEGGGRRGAFEPHAASPRSDSGLQAGVRTASEGTRHATTLATTTATRCARPLPAGERENPALLVVQLHRVPTA